MIKTRKLPKSGGSVLNAYCPPEWVKIACGSTIWDSSLPGFGVRISPNGNKYFVVRKRLGPGQAQVKRSLGRYGNPLTLEVARNKAKVILGQILNGTDPRSKPYSEKMKMTEFALMFSAQTDQRKKPGSIRLEASLLKRHILPNLGNKVVSELTRADITAMMHKIAAPKKAKIEKTKARGKAVVKGGPQVANRALRVVSSMMSHAIEIGLRENNPAYRVTKYPEPKRERFLNPDEIERLRLALRDAEEQGINLYAIAAIRLILYTGARKNEILSLKWSYIDWDNSMALLPDSKTGAKGLMLPALAMELLSSLPRREGAPWVLPSLVSDTHLIGLQKVWAGVRGAAGLEDVRLHDLRHTFASIGAAQGLSLYIVGKALGHARPSTTQRYAHLSDAPVVQAVDHIANQIGKL